MNMCSYISTYIYIVKKYIVVIEPLPLRSLISGWCHFGSILNASVNILDKTFGMMIGHQNHEENKTTSNDLSSPD